MSETDAAESHQGGRTYEDGLGGHITILEEGGPTAPMRFRMLMPAGFGPPAPECHPSQREDFRVLRGTLDLGKIDGERVVLQAGDTFTLPAGTFHLPSNKTDGELEFEATLTPGLDAAAMFASIYDATREHRGVGRFARVAMVFRRHRRLISFPAPVAMVMRVVAGVARWLGIRPPG
jgi:mannose-6-phosphate isomerase-like protein (cupin superfamily)